MKKRSQYLTVAETAETLAVSTKTVRRWLGARTFPNAIDLAKRTRRDAPASHDYRIPWTDLEPFLTARRVFSEEAV